VWTAVSNCLSGRRDQTTDDRRHLTPPVQSSRRPRNTSSQSSTTYLDTYYLPPFLSRLNSVSLFISFSSLPRSCGCEISLSHLKIRPMAIPKPTSHPSALSHLHLTSPRHPSGEEKPLESTISPMHLMLQTHSPPSLVIGHAASSSIFPQPDLLIRAS